MRIAIALSGGVDSSFSALHLKEEGNTVEAFTFKVNNIFDTSRASFVADVLGIKHHIIDLSEIFTKEIINYFINSYLKGYTPNPCALCNRKIKSDIFIREIQKFGDFDFFASGHYVGKTSINSKEVLKEHKDIQKSQTYFLSLINPNSLKKLLFPLENYTKNQVKKIMIDRFSEIFKEEKESFEICFVKDKKYYNFIRKRIKEKRRKGFFVDKEGKILGEHSGFYKYTIGQRKGLRISTGKKMYVFKIEPEKNLVYLGDEKDIIKDSFLTGSINWFYEPENLKNVKVRTRYRGELATVEEIKERKGKNYIKLKTPLKSITPGQLASFYLDDILIGGALIEREN